MFKRSKKKESSPEGFLLPGFLLIGLGFGFIYNNVLAGVLIGLGCGFIAIFLASILKKK